MWASTPRLTAYAWGIESFADGFSIRVAISRLGTGQLPGPEDDGDLTFAASFADGRHGDSESSRPWEQLTGDNAFHVWIGEQSGRAHFGGDPEEHWVGLDGRV